MSIVKTGTTTLGLVYKDGVILAADRRATADHIVANKNAEKVMAISDSIGITTAGMVADLQAIGQDRRGYCHRKDYFKA